ncbi:hypothetical protein PQX77_021129 [Marasmius sp. AFHP31]|nr:hypothetical protein PQX77_021129 [Marasmius sp. AFHP31]
MDPLTYFKGEYKKVYSETSSGAAKLPKGYEPSQPFQITGFHSPHTTDYGNEPPGALVCTALPAVTRQPTLSNYPDGWTQCLISPAAKRAIVNTPGFPQRIQRPPEVRHRIAPTSDRGVGIFAKVDLKAGDLIFSERPMLIATPTVPMPHPSQVPSYFTQQQVMQVGLQQAEKQLEMVFSRFLKEQQEAYMALYNSHKHDGSGPILGVMRTNSFGVLVGGEIYGSVCKDASRFNHRYPLIRPPDSMHCASHSPPPSSCCPNTGRTFNQLTFAMEIRAVRDINKGEELTNAYVDIELPHRARQQDLNPYGFQCHCSSCKNPTESDARRALYREHTPRFAGSETRMVVWLMSPELPEDYVVKNSKQQLAMMQDDGLETANAYVQHLHHLVDVYCAAENLAEVVIYLSKLDVWQRVVVGGEKKSVAELVKKAKAHRTWGWKSRVSDVMKFLEHEA